MKNAGPQDFVPPVVSAGKLLNRIVSLSSPLPYVGAQVTVTDNLSGAVGGQLFLNTLDGEPYLGFYGADPLASGTGTEGPTPVKNGAYNSALASLPERPPAHVRSPAMRCATMRIIVFQT